jgi:excisionase family DNA binding protein
MLFSKKQAAEKLGISEKTLSRKVIEGTITFYKIGRRILFDQNSLDEFIAKCRRNAGGVA